MAILVLNSADVERCLDPLKLVDALDSAFRQVSQQRAQMPVRLTIPVATGGLQVVMPAYLPDDRALATKIVSVFPANPGKGLPLILGVVVLNDADTGAAIALLDGAMVTGLRTAAGSALSVRALARPNAGVLAIIGTGLQAATHLHAIAAVRQLTEVRVVGRTLESGQAFKERFQKSVGAPIRALGSAEDAIKAADIVVLVTTAAQPIVRFEWFSPGAHLCAVGSHAPGKREVDSATIAKATLITVDTKAGALAEAGDLQVPIAEGVISADRIVELGEILLGTRPGRKTDGDITVYKSVGMAAMDAAAARLAYEVAIAENIGARVAF
jgi:ornithine cyclodeaminase